MVAFHYSRQFRTAPVLRYPGGKADVVGLLRHYRPEGVKELREPFVGGGSFFFEVGFTCARAWLNDMHDGLMAVYAALRDRPEEFIAKCRAIAPAQPDDRMTGRGVRGGAPKNARLKAIFDQLKLDESADQALRYFFINRTNFGSGRVNYDIPSRQCFGSSAGWTIAAIDRLEQAASALQGVRLTCGDYLPLFEEPGDDVLIFADPPYVVNSRLSASSQLYQHSFTEGDHYAFAEAVRNCRHKVMVTYDEDEHGLVRSLFPAEDYLVEELGWRYAGSTLGEKKLGRELLICNYEPPCVAWRYGESCAAP